MVRSAAKYQSAIARYLDVKPDQIFLYWKGRVALYAILKAMHVKQGDEVILPAFTCVVVPNAILYLGAKPVYVDIDRETLTPPFEAIQQAVTRKTKAILCQNTFGLSVDVERIAGFGEKNGIYTIEDCAHGFGGTYKNQPNGTFCDASFFSTQWNKPFSTGLGGFAYINNTDLLPAIHRVNKALVKPTKREEFTLNLLINLKKQFLNDNTYWSALKTYRFLSRFNLILGSSKGEEVRFVQEPSRYFKSACRVQLREGVKSIKKLDAILRQRRACGRQYTSHLKKMGKWHVKEDFIKDHAFLRYPILAKNREALMKEARKAKIRLGDWFSSPLHPVQSGLQQWGFHVKAFPRASYIARHIVNLPTEQNMDPIVQFIRENKKLLI